MANLIARRIRMAFATRGLKIPRSTMQKSADSKPHPENEGSSSPQVSKAQSQPPTVSLLEVCERWWRSHPRPEKAKSRPLDLSCYGTPGVPQHDKAPKPGFRLHLNPGARLLIGVAQTEALPILAAFCATGRSTQCGDGRTDARELVLGLDFGTSSVKTVIGDSALGKAFAVPFRDGDGVKRYLLPSRLYETGGCYSLGNGGEAHRDLKLALIAAPSSAPQQERVAAFLALVIRHARGWLFTTQRDVYRRSRLVWKLAIGLPIAYHLDDELFRVFTKVGQAAWLAAGDQEEVSALSVKDALLKAERARIDPGILSEDEDVEVSIVPEVAAQIYGFVNSSRFDKNAPNIYLLTDVGAGSVDSALFHVKPAKGGRWDFEFLTSVVEPHGVMNLHRHRVGWWQEELGKIAGSEALLAALAGLKFPTDREMPLPDQFTEYFSGIGLQLSPREETPDDHFFMKRLVRQVRGKSYWSAWRDGLISRSQLVDIPAFYCGGGMRMSFYTHLQEEMKSHPNATWLKANPRPIQPPRNLEAPGLRHQDYDRLTVAYGLSFLEVGKITRSLPRPKLSSEPISSWRDNYVSKDDC
ncbi:hypothetical protein [Accumulibacter sp.]|uniref:hypothetical protein n=1 Tax=Accumulibacter sp. TaxID=2053492 RepID=UPI00263449B0|nr:hypothetical protein [Accumulibacter sp.]